MSTTITIGKQHAIALAKSKDHKNNERHEAALLAWEEMAKEYQAETKELERKLELHRKDQSFWGPTASFRDIQSKLMWRHDYVYHALYSPSKDPHAENLLKAFELNCEPTISISVDDINYLTS